MAVKLTAEQARRTVDPARLAIQTTLDLPPAEGIVGQDRAVAALQFGLAIRDGGYNIYVAGPPGIGKMTAVRAFLTDIARARPTPPDICYVYNFDTPYQPTALRLPAGRGRRLQQDLAALLDHLRRAVPQAFEADDYTAQRDQILKSLSSEREALIEQLTHRAAQAGFALQMTPVGIVLVAMSGGHPLSEADFQALPAEAREQLIENREHLQEQLNETLKQGRALERAAQERLQQLDRQVAEYVVGGMIDDLAEAYQDLPAVTAYLNAVRSDIQQHIEPFKEKDTETPASPMAAWAQDQNLRKYVINLLVDNSRLAGAPVIVEANPSFTNLFGRIEKESMFGALSTDHTLIKPGALHLADGGYLVVPVEDLLRSPLSWDGLKRALVSGHIQIEDPGERLGLITTKSLQPEPLPLGCKIILIGSAVLYHLLHAYDESFPELFRVKADFDTSMPWEGPHEHTYLSMLATICRNGHLRPLDREAAAQVLEHAARMVEDQQRLSTRFGVIAELLREADFWASQTNADVIGAAHVLQALDARIYRSNLLQERIQELINRGTLVVNTSGRVIGQVNGLSVITLGDYSFGRPSRITASVGPGRSGVLDIEREVELGGAIHSKGVLILSGYLSARYGHEAPLALAARLVFEQSYEGVDGDSASSAELYALLSALAGLPIDQGIAVTGSVSQHGQIQAIGGVNQKIEGFFETCRARGLTGSQGVLIPHSNLAHLMLRDEVVTAIRDQRFHIWAVETVDEGIALLTGRPADEIHTRVAARLQAFAEALKATSERG